ncbi:unnamed protein product [Meloidogyne enterolobii]|uniref:Uncharacterized protein n=1 Tax=Meloidogyne enterolobii TaxID=390850 RepID=A0ACB0ZLY2_MELEN
MEKILKHVNEQLNIPKIVKDGEQNVLKIKQLETKIGELTCSNAAVTVARCFTYQVFLIFKLTENRKSRIRVFVYLFWG